MGSYFWRCPLILRCLCFHSPIILGVPIFWAWSILWHSLILGGIYHAYYTIPYSLGASSYSYHSSPSHSLTHHSQQGSSYIDRQALPHASRATSQPHSTMLSLPYPYTTPMVYPYPMPIPMEYTEPWPHTPHSAHRAMREPQRHTASHGHGIGTTTGTARHREPRTALATAGTAQGMG